MQHLPLCALCLVVMAAFVIAEHAEKYTAGVILKGCASLVFVLVGVLGSRGVADEGYARMVVIGLAIGAVADVILNLRYVFPKVGQLLFALGTLVFLAGHVAYCIATYPRAGGLVPVALVAGGALTVVLMRWIFSQIEAKAALKAIGVLYVGIVVVLNCLAVAALAAAPGAQAATFLMGTLLFLVSDVVLILNTFGGSPRFSLRVCNLTLYYLGQLLIALSLQLVVAA